MRVCVSRSCLFAGVVAVLACSATAYAETAAQASAAGDAALQQGDLTGALQAYARAIQQEPSNQEFVEQFMLVRRAAALKERLKEETDAERWTQMAQALRSFYFIKGLHAQALPVDEQIHARLDTASSASQLAETQLVLKRDGDAAKVLSSLAPEHRTVETQSLLGVALARQGKKDKARQIADALALADDANCDTLYAAARLHAAVGNDGQSLALLTRCFESAPPSRLDAAKAYTRQVAEFSRLTSTAEFAQVMQTKSKVPESACSGGSSCSSCPMRGRCSGSHGR